MKLALWTFFKWSNRNTSPWDVTDKVRIYLSRLMDQKLLSHLLGRTSDEKNDSKCSRVLMKLPLLWLADINLLNLFKYLELNSFHFCGEGRKRNARFLSRFNFLYGLAGDYRESNSFAHSSTDKVKYSQLCRCPILCNYCSLKARECFNTQRFNLSRTNDSDSDMFDFYL